MLHQVINAFALGGGAGGGGSISRIGATQTGFTGAGSPGARALPGGLLENDLVIIAYNTAGVSGLLSPNIPGYTLRDAVLFGGGTFGCRLGIFYKFMGPVPDTTYTPDPPGVTGACIAVAFRGVDPASPFDVADVTSAGGGASNPNPPPIAPSHPNAWSLFAGGKNSGSSGAAFTSSDLTDFVSQFTNGTSYDSIVGMGHHASSASFDPAAWGGSAGSSSSSFCARSMALRPA